LISKKVFYGILLTFVWRNFGFCLNFGSLIGWPNFVVENPGQFQRKSVKTRNMKQNLKNWDNPGKKREDGQLIH
jgi:hypothetical protein